MDFQKELEKRQRRIKESEKWLQDGEVVDDQIPSTYYSIALNNTHLGAIYLLEGELHSSQEKFADSAKNYLTRINEKKKRISTKWYENETLNCRDALHTAILSGDDKILDKVSEKCLEIDETYPSGEHVPKYMYYYVKAFASHLNEEKKEAKNYLNQINSIQADKNIKEIAKARETYLVGLIDKDRKELMEGINKVLEFHDKEYGQDLSTATDFMSVEASAYIMQVQKEGFEITSMNIDEDLVDYIPENILN